MSKLLSLQERIADRFIEDMDVLTDGLVATEEPMYGRKKLTAQEELDMWDFVDPGVNVDALRVEGLNDRTLKLLEDVGIDTKRIDLKAYQRAKDAGRPDETWIGALRHKHQYRLMTSGGRALSKEQQLKYYERMQKRSAERRAERESEQEMTPP